MVEIKATQILFDLLKAGLWGGEPQLLEFFPLSENEWTSVYKYAVAHTVEGVVFDGILQLPKDFFPPRGLFMKWFVRREKIEQQNLAMNVEIADQVGFLQEAGLSPLLIKGQGVASCYRHPLSRVSGDIDWVFLGKKQFENGISFFRSQGRNVVKDTSISALLKWKNCEVDLHGRLFDLYNPFRSKFLEKLMARECSQRRQILINKKTVLLPSILEQMLISNTHIFRHLLSFGIGLRHICDSAMLYSYYHSAYDRQELSQIYDHLGIGRWMASMHVILFKYFGLPPAFLPEAINENADVDWVMEDILSVGNFGFYRTQDNRRKTKICTQQQKLSLGVRRLLNYLPLAPMESICFPIAQIYNKLIK